MDGAWSFLMNPQWVDQSSVIVECEGGV
jgi:hypothetical protein